MSKSASCSCAVKQPSRRHDLRREAASPGLAGTFTHFLAVTGWRVFDFFRPHAALTSMLTLVFIFLEARAGSAFVWPDSYLSVSPVFQLTGFATSVAVCAQAANDPPGIFPLKA